MIASLWRQRARYMLTLVIIFMLHNLHNQRTVSEVVADFEQCYKHTEGSLLHKLTVLLMSNDS